MVGRIRVSRTFCCRAEKGDRPRPGYMKIIGRYLCGKWKMLSLSGLNALLFLQLLIALVTMSAVYVSAISIGFLLVSLVTN